jgi:hypothetical protein
MAKKNPVKEINQLMDERAESLEAIENLNNAITEKTKALREKIAELTKEDEAEINHLGTSITNIEEKVEALMKKNNIKEFPHKSAYLKFAGSRSINVEIAKAILPPEMFRRIAKFVINVGSAEKLLSPTEFNKVKIEAKPHLKFLKPKKDVEEVIFEDGVKTVVK